MNIRKHLNIFLLFCGIFSCVKTYHPHEIIDLGIQEKLKNAFIHKNSNSIVLIKKDGDFLDSNNSYEIQIINLNNSNYKTIKKIDIPDYYLTNIKVLSNSKKILFVSTWSKFISFDDQETLRNFNGLNTQETINRTRKFRSFDTYPFTNIENHAQEIQRLVHEIKEKKDKTKIILFDTDGNHYTIATFPSQTEKITTSFDETKLFCTIESGKIISIDIPKNLVTGQNITEKESSKVIPRNNICVSPDNQIIVAGSSEIIRSRNMIPNQSETQSNTILSFFDNQLNLINSVNILNNSKNFPVSGKKEILNIDINHDNQIIIVQRDKIYIYNPYKKETKKLTCPLAKSKDDFGEEVSLDRINDAEFINYSNLIKIQLDSTECDKIKILDSLENKFKFTLKINFDFKIFSSQVDEKNILYVVIQKKENLADPLGFSGSDYEPQTYLIKIPLLDCSLQNMLQKEYMIHPRKRIRNIEKTLLFDFDENNKPVIIQK